MTATEFSSHINPKQFDNFPHLFSRIVENTPEKIALRFLSFSNNDLELTYRELMQQVTVASSKIRQHCNVGDRAIILLPAGADFVSWFVGCFYAGAVATPTAVPVQRREWERLVNILQDAAPRLLVTDTDTLEKLQQADILPAIKKSGVAIVDVNLVASVSSGTTQPSPIEVTAEMLAFLQYTSGSTGNPKGVMVSHGNLMHNEEAIRQGLRVHTDSVVVSWLPLFHDMGLIGQMLQSLYNGATLCLMSPESFLRDPLRWLEAITQYGGSVAGAPNFAYELCVKRAKAQPERLGAIDLSRWATAFNGAEPVRAETLEKFSAVFSACGFSASSWYPCYGLAECTLFVSGPSHAHAPRYVKLDSESLQSHKVVASQAEDAKLMVSAGVVFGDHQVRIVNTDTLQSCTENQVGEIWIQGGSVGQGYWNRDEATAADFKAYTAEGDGPFLRTGDLGFLLDGCLYISARYKDMIIINGKNFYPQDIERSAEFSHPALRPGCSCAFSLPSNGNEQLVVLAEVDPKKCTEADFTHIISAIRKNVFEQQGASAVQVALYAPYTLFKTSSGKIQRRSCSAAFAGGQLKALQQWCVPSKETSSPSIQGSVLQEVMQHIHQQKEYLATFNAQMEDSMRQLDALMAPLKKAEPAPTVESLAEPMAEIKPQKGSKSRSEIRRWLGDYIQRELGLNPSMLNDESAFSDYGLDSAQALELCAALSDWIGFEVPVTQLWNCPNVAEFSASLHEQARNETQQDSQHAWVGALSEKDLHSLLATELAR